METKKTEQKWFIWNSKFGKHFYALALWLAFVLSSWFYFFVSASDLTVETSLSNAWQTIERVSITSDGTPSWTSYFDFNSDWRGGALFNAVPNWTIERSLWLDGTNHLVYSNVWATDDGDRSIDGASIYRLGWYVSIWTNTYPWWKLNIVSDEKHPELYIEQTSGSAANIVLKNPKSSYWTLWANTNDIFYIWVSGQLNSLYLDNLWNTFISKNLKINNGSLDMSWGDINNGNIVTAVAFVMSSDKNLKENIQIIKSPLDKIYALNGYTFDWRKDGRADLGLIAQEVQKVLPELVHIDTNGHMWVEYANMVALLIEWIKELWNKVDGLYNKYLDQQKTIDDLEARIEKLEKI